jgi:deoxyhypusine monooxygenase
LTPVLGYRACRVRHEAAEALGAIASEATVALLNEYAKDAEPIVADSCRVALDMLEFEKSGAEYCAGVAAAAAASS